MRVLVHALVGAGLVAAGGMLLTSYSNAGSMPRMAGLPTVRSRRGGLHQKKPRRLGPG